MSLIPVASLARSHMSSRSSKKDSISWSVSFKEGQVISGLICIVLLTLARMSSLSIASVEILAGSELKLLSEAASSKGAIKSMAGNRLGVDGGTSGRPKTSASRRVREGGRVRKARLAGTPSWRERKTRLACSPSLKSCWAANNASRVPSSASASSASSIAVCRAGRPPWLW